MITTMIILGNALLLIILFSLLDIGNTIMLSDYFNRDTKCYFFKEKDKVKYNNFERRFVKYHGEKVRLYNERGMFVDSFLTYPIGLFLVILPILIIFPTKLFSWTLFGAILVHYYLVIFVYVRFKRNNIELMDENSEYDISYTALSINANRLTVFLIPLYILGVVVSNDLRALLILFILILKLHFFIFIDKIDSYLNWNILEKRKLDNLSGWLESLFYIAFALFIIIMYHSIDYIF